MRLAAVQHADPRQPFHVRTAGRDVVHEELAIQQYVVAGEKPHDALVGAGALLLPKQVAHASSVACAPRTSPSCAKRTLRGDARELIEPQSPVEILHRLRGCA